jgi:hypothetical protein
MLTRRDLAWIGALVVAGVLLRTAVWSWQLPTRLAPLAGSVDTLRPRVDAIEQVQGTVGADLSKTEALLADINLHLSERGGWRERTTAQLRRMETLLGRLAGHPNGHAPTSAPSGGAVAYCPRRWACGCSHRGG